MNVHFTRFQSTPTNGGRATCVNVDHFETRIRRNTWSVAGQFQTPAPPAHIRHLTDQTIGDEMLHVSDGQVERQQGNFRVKDRPNFCGAQNFTDGAPQEFAGNVLEDIKAKQSEVSWG